jgi:NTP pyrophosphatase (non-canonical NTP hydrolase)
MSMYLNDYQLRAKNTAIYKERMYPVVSLGVEAAELADLFVKPVLRGGEHDVWPTRKQIIKEAGDVLWMLASILTDNSIQLSDVAATNLLKLEDRNQRGVLSGSGDER